MPIPTRGDVIRQLDVLRGRLRIAMTTIRKMNHGDKADADAVLRKLAQIRAEAKEVGMRFEARCSSQQTATPFRRKPL